MENNLIFFISASYLTGSIPFGYILTKLFGYGDIRKIGSGNMGATNVLRTGRRFLATYVLFLDIIKGFLPIVILYLFYEKNFQSYEIYFIGSFSIIGHIFPIWLKFKGGKGVATYIGFLLGAYYLLGIIFILFWIIIAFTTRYSSLASILSSIIIPFVSITLLYNYNLTFILVLLSILIIFKHYSNIQRLLSKSENKIKL